MAYDIYTIGREFGSNGLAVGEALAKKLGINFYDKELLQEAAKKSGFCEEILENHDEKPTNSFLYSLVMDTYSTAGYATAPFLDMPLNHKVLLAQFDAIKSLAEQESCVIVGRCADYALADKPNVVNVFIRADLEDRIKNVSKRLDISNNKAKDLCHKKDKQRSSYYNYYTSKKWGDSRSYDLCINLSKISIDDAVDMIISYKKNMKKI